MSFPYLIQGSNVTVVIDNVPHTISKTHITYQKVVDAIKAGEWESIRDIISPKKMVLNYGKGFVSIVGDTLYWKGEELHNSLTSRMIEMLKEGFSVEPLANFMENLMMNPSKRAVTELYGFLEKNNLPITPDGYFLAYKRVRGDYKDCHSGTMDNSVGRYVEMDRNKVDDDRDRTCSTGLHFCSHSYLSHFGGERTVIVKIHPADVVSIPSDYNDAKGRTCAYEVVGEIDNKVEDGVEFTKPVQSNANSVKREPKTGSTPFYRGYTDGYFGGDYNPGDYWSMSDQNAYEEGYEKGQMHGDDGYDERYRYVQPAKKVNKDDEVWPFPSKK